ncbi:unnamed protein product [Calypogeia fissa]
MKTSKNQAWTIGDTDILHIMIITKTTGRHSLKYCLYPAPGPEAYFVVSPSPSTDKSQPTSVPFSICKLNVNSVSLLTTQQL